MSCNVMSCHVMSCHVTWKRKYEMRFPMTALDMFIAQKMPEFLVIVSSSELLARKVPCNNYISRNC